MRMIRKVVVVAAGLSFLACGAGDQDAPALGSEGSGAEPPGRTIQIRLDTSADPDTIIVEDSVAVAASTGANVSWTSPDQDAMWLVVFQDSTPFPGAKETRVFHGAGTAQQAAAKIPQGHHQGQYKYWVFYPTSDTTYIYKDPKLVVIDDKAGLGGDTIGN